MGMSILDYSKTHMYSFYYDVLKPKYDDKIKLVYTDTDSYVIKVETDDLYEDFKEINDYSITTLCVRAFEWSYLSKNLTGMRWIRVSVNH